MYAVIQEGGKQYVVKEGDEIRVELLEVEPGQSYEIQRVLLVGDDSGAVRVGKPTVDGARVEAVVLGHGKEKKIKVFKKKRRKGYHKLQGHRQRYTALKIVKIAVE